MAAYGYIVRRHGRVVDAGGRLGRRQDLIKELLTIHGTDAEVECPFVGDDDSLADIGRDIRVLAQGGQPPPQSHPFSLTAKQRLDQLLAAIQGQAHGLTPEKAIEIVKKGRYGEMVLDCIYAGEPSVDEVAKFLAAEPNLKAPAEE